MPENTDKNPNPRPYLLDFFAMAALQALIPTEYDDATFTNLATESYKYADAMLIESAKHRENDSSTEAS